MQHPTTLLNLSTIIKDHVYITVPLAPAVASHALIVIICGIGGPSGLLGLSDDTLSVIGVSLGWSIIPGGLELRILNLSSITAVPRLLEMSVARHRMTSPTPTGRYRLPVP